jgi:hypothetical protein
MSHDSDIELIPGTTTIYKRAYRMPTKKLVQLKGHIQELQENGYIHPSSSSQKKMVLKGYVLTIMLLMRSP